LDDTGLGLRKRHNASVEIYVLPGTHSGTPSPLVCHEWED